jgi:hypothetical protein
MCVLRNNEARSRNHCCRGKAKSVTHYEYVFTAPVIRHANRIFSSSYYIVI